MSNYLSVGVAWVDFELKMRQFLSGICITRDRGVSFRSGGGGRGAGGTIPSAEGASFVGGSAGMLPMKIFENLSF